MTSVAVVPNHVRLTGRNDLRISLFDSKGPHSIGRIGAALPARFVRSTGRTSSILAWDLASLAMGVVAADRSVSRHRTSADGWTRRIALTVGVNQPDRWRPTIEQWKDVLNFLTGDLWDLNFVAGGCQPVPRRKPAPPRPEACISLLSGGLDSLVGAIDLVTKKSAPLFVSHVVTGDSDKQLSFAREMKAASSHLQLNANPQTGNNPELSQRSRSLAFIACGVLAGSILDRHLSGDRIDLIIPENGYISLNVPLTPLRGGSLSTRTTHPTFLRGLNAILDALGFRIGVVNPYGLMTKGEMLANCADQALLQKLASSSMSCGHGGRPTGPGSKPHVACGRCLPCLVRRGAFLRWTNAVSGDKTTYLHPADLKRAARDPEFASYDDVMQARLALRQIRSQGAERWIGPAITRSHFNDTAIYRSVAERGMREIGAFLQAVGTP